MRSARTLLTTAAASAVIVLGAPGAYAASLADWDHDDSSYSKEHDNGSKHEKPNGGMDTGGGALTAVGEGDWDGGESKKDEGSESSKKDEGSESYKKDEGSESYKKDEGEKSWEGDKHEKPNGGMDTGGGALTAVGEGDWDGGESKKDEGSESYKKDEGSESYKKDEGEKSEEGDKHEKPNGGMDTGGGALTAVGEGDWDGGESKKDEGSESYKKDEGSETYKKDEGSETYKQDEGEKSWGGEHEKPRGGMHTGGGGLDMPTTTAGGLAVLAVAGAGLYAVRRKKSANGMA
ncbi:hypothetical protein ACFWR9_26245 [Streptomyces sp. NPDC058534]|uniref:hypothetical protein n=1 Tax=Streptomyces sp. NPDC058534 TaxID=3346541 RepID=UPI00365A9D94